MALAESVNYGVYRPCRRYLWSRPSTPSAERPEFQAGHVPPQLGRGSSLLSRSQCPSAVHSSVLDDRDASRSICGVGRRTVSVSLRRFVEAGRSGGEVTM